MSAADHEKAGELFLQARELPPESRTAFLDENCGEGSTLRAAVEVLLDADERATFLENAKGVDLRVGLQELSSEHLINADTVNETLPENIGKFRIVAKIGQGGMGTVYEATQENPNRRIALKVLPIGLTTATLRQRLRREAQVLGQLQHPGIAQIYEAGFIDSDSSHMPSQPFIAMELVKGKSLDEFVIDNKLALESRLELIARVCDALSHAHLRGIVHRDLKPSNILVEETGQPRILDFGVARVTDADIQNVTLQTEIGQLIGTLSYMSPEQTAGDSALIDVRSDVYSLGVILYEVLAGQQPFSFSNLAIHEAVQRINNDEPTTLGALSSNFRGDVETIVQKAMEKDRDRRYSSAELMAADLRRYLRHEPIEARPATLVYHVKKFAVRNKVLVGGMVTTLLALSAGLIGSLYFLKEARTRQTELQGVVNFQARMLTNVSAEEMGQQLIAEIRSGTLRLSETDDAFSDEDLAEYNALLSRLDATGIASRILDTSILSHAVTAVEQEFSEQPLVQADLCSSLGTVYNVLGLYEQANTQFKKSLHIRTQHLGPEHEKSLIALRDSAAMYALLGDYTEAERLFSSAQEKMTKVLGDHHPETLKTLLRLGDSYENMTRLEDAKRVFEQARDLTTTHLGDTHHLSLRAAESLGNLYRVTSKLEEAKKLLQEVLAAREALQGSMHKDTIQVRKHLAFVLQLQKSYEEAEPMLISVLEASKVLHGENHPNTLSAAHSLGNIYVHMHRYEQAEPIIRDTLDRRSRLLGVEHPATIRSINTLAHLLLRTDRRDDAIPLLMQSLDAARRTLGTHHNTTMVTTLNLATATLEAGNFQDAVEYARRAWKLRSEIFGNENYRTLIAKSVIGEALLASEEYVEATEIFRELLDVSRRSDLQARPLYSSALGRYALGAIASGESEKAESVCRELLSLCNAKFSDRPEAIGRAERLLASCLVAQGRFKDAEALLATAIPNLLEQLEPEHWQVHYTKVILAGTRLKQGIDASEASISESAELVRKNRQNIKIPERALILTQIAEVENQLRLPR